MTDAIEAVWLDGQADAIRKLASRSSADIIEIGKRLIDVKERLPYGEFLPWIEHEFGWSRPTATRFMQVAKAFGAQSVQVEHFDPSALYALASGNVPDEVRDRFVAQAEAGEPVRHREVRQAIAEARQAPALAPTFVVVEQETGEIVGDAVPTPTPMLPEQTAAEWYASLSPAAQETAATLAEGMIEAGAPAAVAQDLSKTQVAILKADRFLAKVGDDRVRELADRSPDLATTLRQCIETCNRLADRCRRIVGEQGTGLRRIV